MKKIVLFCLLMVILFQEAFAQIKWGTDSLPPERISWNNYSTSYVGDISDSIPFLVTAIPYNGMYSNYGDMNTQLDLSFEGSLFRFQSNLFEQSRRLYTYDSSDVYFLAPGIYRGNADQYEYRVTLDARTVITPWSGITKFSNIQLNNFKKGFAFLGGYKTTWGNYLIVELRKKMGHRMVSSAIIYWKEIRPVIASIYTSKNLNEFFMLLKRSWEKPKVSAIPVKDSVFSAAENTIIFYLSANVYKKEAIEYQLIRNGKVYRNWNANDYDFNFIWLKGLDPGKYKLNIRYTKQRQNVSTYDFEITPLWHQTITFKIIAGSLIAACLGFVALLFRSVQQKRRLQNEQSAKEKLQLELKSIYSQLNPHFIFNSLNSIQGLINKNDLASANHYLSEFGALLRSLLAGVNTDFTTLDKEIAAIERYLKLEQLRFHFQYDIHTDDQINLVETQMPSLLLQPILENAVKHGIPDLKDKGRIHLSFVRKNNDLQATVTDNGSGFIDGKIREGHGLRLTCERIHLLNELLDDRSIKLILPDCLTSGASISLLFKNWLP